MARSTRSSRSAAAKPTAAATRTRSATARPATKPPARSARPVAANSARSAAKPIRSAAAKPVAKPTLRFAPPTYPRTLVTSQLARVRELCHQLPDVIERPSHGSPAFLIGGKRAFAYFLDNHHGDGRLALWCAAPDGAQAMLVDSNPGHYFVPPYVGPSGWVGVRLDRDAAWSEIAAVLEAAHQLRHQPPRAARSPRAKRR